MMNVNMGHFLFFCSGIRLKTNGQKPELIANDKVFWYNIEKNILFVMDFLHFLDVDKHLETGIQKNALYRCKYELKQSMFPKNDLIGRKKIVFHSYEIQNKEIKKTFIDKINNFLLSNIEKQIKQNVLIAKILETETHDYLNKQKQGSLFQIIVSNANFSSMQLNNYDNVANKTITTNFIDKHKNFLINQTMIFLNVTYNCKIQCYEWNSKSFFLNLQNTFLRSNISKILLKNTAQFITLTQFDGTLTDLLYMVKQKKQSLQFQANVKFEVNMQQKYSCLITHKCKNKWHKNNIRETCVFCKNKICDIFRNKTKNNCFIELCIDGLVEYKNEHYKIKIIDDENLHKLNSFIENKKEKNRLKNELIQGDELSCMSKMIEKQYLIECILGIRSTIAIKQNNYFEINQIIKIQEITIEKNTNINNCFLDLFGLSYFKKKKQNQN